MEKKMPITAKAWVVALAISTVCALISLMSNGSGQSKNLLLAAEGALWLVSLAGAFHEADKASEKVWVPDIKNMDPDSEVIRMKRVSIRA